MKNITVAVPNKIYRKARIWAASHDTSVSAVVAFLLQNLDAVVARRARYDATRQSNSSSSQAISTET